MLASYTIPATPEAEVRFELTHSGFAIRRILTTWVLSRTRLTGFVGEAFKGEYPQHFCRQRNALAIELQPDKMGVLFMPYEVFKLQKNSEKNTFDF